MIGENVRENAKPPQKFLSEGLLIAIVPIAMYVLGFSYESGYLKYYDIPLSLIAIDTPSMISAALFGAVYVIVFLFWVSFAIDSSGGDSYLEKTIGGLMLYLGFFPLIVLIMMGVEFLNAIIVCLFGIMTIVIFLRKIEKKSKRVKNFSVKLYGIISEHLLYSQDSVRKRTALNLLQDALGAAILLMIPFFFAFAAGFNNAKNEERFNVIKVNESELAIIRIYGANIIAMPFSRLSSSVGGGFFLLKIENLNEVFFKNEKIGPLKKHKINENE